MVYVTPEDVGKALANYVRRDIELYDIISDEGALNIGQCVVGLFGFSEYIPDSLLKNFVRKGQNGISSDTVYANYSDSAYRSLLYDLEKIGFIKKHNEPANLFIKENVSTNPHTIITKPYTVFYWILDQKLILDWAKKEITRGGLENEKRENFYSRLSKKQWIRNNV